MDTLQILDSVCADVAAAPLPDYACNNGVLLRTFPDADENDMDAALQTAAALGFAVYADNRLEINRYVTLYRDGTQAHIYYIPAERTLRVIVDGFSAPFPCRPINVPQRCPAALWMIETDHTYIDCGMCFVLRCKDNSFFVIDSGHFLQINDHKRLYRFLRERTPAGENVIISGWFVTHAHDDHICKMMDFLADAHTDVVIEKLYYNTVRGDVRDSVHWSECSKRYLRQFDEAMEHSGIPIVKLHSGQRFYVRNFTMDVLCTHEDVYPDSLENFNDTSTVLMIETDGCRVCIPGDAGQVESDCMTGRFSAATLGCDVMQQSHHGHFGTTPEFYRMANARLLLFPNTQIIFDEDLPRYEANRVAIALADAYHVSSNGTVEVPLPYSPGAETVLPDETFENFDRIQALWGYTYTPERKQALFDAFLSRCGLPATKDIET